ncbi:MAG: glycosyltransferase, partial [Cellulosilyticaceae bacterium]
EKKKRLLVGSPICQKSEILEAFLTSLEEVDKKDLEVDYLFVDDNEEVASKALLRVFEAKNHGVTLLDGENRSKYIADDFTHRWTEDMVQKVALFKDKMIEVAREEGYDYLFLVDSDIVLHPNTFKQLISDEKDIVSNIFWTQWGPNQQEMPQVWMQDAYSFHTDKSNVRLSEEDLIKKNTEFIQMLRKPGVYRVGGLGACTLMSRRALLAGVNFKDVYNVSFWGEDRHFCIRAVALGLELFVDTYYPAYHIYRSENLEGLDAYKASHAQRENEVLGTRVLDQVVEGVNRLLTYTYEAPIDTSFMPYFVEEEGNRQLDKLQENRVRVEKQKLINRGNVMECTMSIGGDHTRVGCQIKYCNNGFKKGFSYYEEYKATCVMEQQVDGKFRINHFETEERLPLQMTPLVRKIQEKPTITLSMIVKNEEGRYLERMLKAANAYIDRAVIIDDGSTDRTGEICKAILGDKLTLITNDQSKFANETEVRKQQWFETISTNPDWILFLDADEIFEERAVTVMRELIRSKD